MRRVDQQNKKRGKKVTQQLMMNRYHDTKNSNIPHIDISLPVVFDVRHYTQMS